MTRFFCFKRVIKDWDNKRVDWILLLKKDKYQLISRWYFKKSASNGNVTISDILGVVLSAQPLDNQQKSHFENYEHAIKAFQELYLKGLNRDACLFAHLASEHLAKQLLLRTALAFKQKYTFDLSTKHKEPHRSHEVSAIINEVTRVSSEMRTLAELGRLKLAVDDFKFKIGDWASVRYDSPTANQTELGLVGRNLVFALEALVIFLNTKGSVK
jgi:hypothetical protein